MRLRNILAVLACAVLLIGWSASGVAGERAGVGKALVMLGADDGAGPISIYDASDAGKDVDLAAIGNMLMGGQYDAAVIPLGHSSSMRPFSACDNVGDCADAAEAACGVIDEGVRSLTFELSTKTCSAECDGGRLVETTCPTADHMPRIIIVDDGAPI